MPLTISNQENKRMILPMKKAILTYGMIQDGDRVAVGLSGGKDSSSLLYLLTVLQKRLPIHFEIVPLSLTLGFDGMDIKPLADFTKELGHALYTEQTNIGEVVFDIRKEKNPCSLCANLRRGILYDLAKSHGCNKVALGHHLDDAIETFFMNLFFSGKAGTFKPKTYLDRTDLTLIRPMIAVSEQLIIQFVSAKGIPVIKNTCPADKKTKREEIKQLITQLSTQYPNLRSKFLHAMQTADLQNFWNASTYLDHDHE